MRVALLLDDLTIKTYFARAVEEMLERTNAEITVIILNESSEDSTWETFRKALNRPAWARLIAGQRIAWKLVGPPAHEHREHLEQVGGLSGIKTVQCCPKPAASFGNILPESVVEIVSDEADICIRNGFGVLKGDILTAPEHGVLSYHHGNPREYRGGPPGLWEFLHDKDQGGIIVQRLSETLDGGEIIAFEDVDLTSTHTWRETQERLFESSIGMLADAVEAVGDPNSTFDSPDELGPVYTAPDIGEYVHYQIKNNTGRLRRMFSR